MQPDDEIPDGDASAPHHAYIGWMLQAAGIAGAWFAFEYIWGTGYSTAGGVLTLAGVGLSIVGLLVALDDVLEHYLGISTPLDQLWTEYLAPYVRRLDRRQ